jgi:hypothetical protein
MGRTGREQVLLGHAVIESHEVTNRVSSSSAA